MFENISDLPKGKIQLAEKQDLLQLFQLGFGIDAVSVVRVDLRTKQTNMIIMVQGTHRHPRKSGSFVDGIACLHRYSPPFLCRIHPAVRSESTPFPHKIKKAAHGQQMISLHKRRRTLICKIKVLLKISCYLTSFSFTSLSIDLRNLFKMCCSLYL